MTFINSVRPFLVLLVILLVFGAGTTSASTEDNTVSKHSLTIPSKQATPSAYKSGAWQLRRLAEFNEIARRGNIDLVFLGDSITQGWEDAGKEVWDTYYSGRHAANFGMNSDHTQHVLWRIDHGNFEGIHPKTIIILIGINNSSAGDPAQEIAAGVVAIVQKLREKTPESKILLLAIFPSGEQPDNPQRMRAIAANTIFQKVADGRMIRYVDIGDRLVNRDGTISQKVMPDFLHLSPRGYGLWAEAIEPVMKDLLGEK